MLPHTTTTRKHGTGQHPQDYLGVAPRLRQEEMKTRQISLMIRVLCVVMLGFCVGGCLIVEQPAERPAPQPAAPAGAVESRSAADLQRENAQLRPQWQKLEEYNARWESAVAQRELELKQLKARRDQLKKDRDYYKKLAEKDDD